MKNIKQVFNESDVTNLKSGDWTIIDGQPAMRRGKTQEGAEYVIPNGDGTITKIDLRGYYLSKGEITPVWYSIQTIDLNNNFDEGGHSI